MTDTINVKVTAVNQWVEALNATSVESGVFSMSSTGQYCSHTGQPDSELVGHRFSGELTPYSLVAGESIYVKVKTPITLIVTKD